MTRYKNIEGAKFGRGTNFFRGTAMGIAMAEAGLIPAPHIIRDKSNECLIRDRNDAGNERPSRRVFF